MPEQAPLPPQFAHLPARYPGCDPLMLTDIVRAVIAGTRAGLTQKEASLLREVEELANTLASARAEITALRADDITNSHIPSATDELDAIVTHTAAATDIILECCEKLDEVAPTLSGPAAQALQDVTTRIYEACSFQDITGQRITKVVSTLQTIERRVTHVMTVFNGGQPVAPSQPAASVARVDDPASLLNGPQLPTSAMGQSDIDALLASFD